MTPEEKANKNILLVLQKLRNFQLQNSSPNIEYRIGNLLMGFSDELSILNMLKNKGLIEIQDSWGNDSSK